MAPKIFAPWTAPGTDNERIFWRWVEANKIVGEPKRTAAWPHLLPGKVKGYIEYGSMTHAEGEPWFDHVSMWQSEADGYYGYGSRILTSEPYYDNRLTADEYVRSTGLDKWCEARGMAVRATKGGSWHNPEGCILLEFRVVYPNMYLNFIKSHVRDGYMMTDDEYQRTLMSGALPGWTE